LQSHAEILIVVDSGKKHKKPLRTNPFILEFKLILQKMGM